MADENFLGGKLKTVRESRNLSREELAARSGCSLELVRHLEEGELVPSLAPLMKLARALGVRLGTFLDETPANGPVITRSDNRAAVVHFSGNIAASGKPGLDFYALARDKRDRHMEPFVIDVHAPAYGDRPLSSHEGEEFIYVLSGELEIFYGKETYVLRPGDSIYLDSVVAHDVHSAPGQEAKILAVVYAPY